MCVKCRRGISIKFDYRLTSLARCIQTLVDRSNEPYIFITRPLRRVRDESHLGLVGTEAGGGRTDAPERVRTARAPQNGRQNLFARELC